MRASSYLNSLLCDAKAGKWEKQAVKPEAVDNSVVGAEPKEVKKSGTKDNLAGVDLSFAIIEDVITDAGGDESSERRMRSWYQIGIDLTKATPPVNEKVVEKTVQEPGPLKKKLPVRLRHLLQRHGYRRYRWCIQCLERRPSRPLCSVSRSRGAGTRRILHRDVPRSLLSGC